MLKYLHYKKGKSVTGSGLRFKKPLKKDFLWIFMSNPSVQEVVTVSKRFNIHPSVFTKYKKENHSIRYNFDPLEAVIVDYYAVGNNIKSAPQLVVLFKNVLIICTPTSEYYESLFETVCENFHKNQDRDKHLSHLFYTYLVEDTNENYDVLEITQSKIEEIDQKIIKTRAEIDIKSLIELKRKLFMIGRRLWASAKVIYMLKKGITPLELGREELRLFDDVYDTFIHQIDMVENQRAMLADSLNIYETVMNNNLASISNNLSIVMKKLTAITLVLMIPTLIASIYGMNFRYMPELGMKYGYFVALGLMVFSMILTMIYVRKKQWM